MCVKARAAANCRNAVGSRRQSLRVAVGVLSLSLAVLVDTGAASLSRTAPAGAGAYLVKDTVPGSNGSIPARFVPVAGTLFFTSYDAHEHGRELWKSDGTDAGTVMVKDIWLWPPGRRLRASAGSRRNPLLHGGRRNPRSRALEERWDGIRHGPGEDPAIQSS